MHLGAYTVAHHAFSQKLRGSLRGGFSFGLYSRKQPRLSLQCTSGRLALLPESRLLLAPSDGSWLTGRKTRDTEGEPHSDSTFSTKKRTKWVILNLGSCCYLQYLLPFCFLDCDSSSTLNQPLPVHFVPKAAGAQQEEASNCYHGNSDAQTDRPQTVNTSERLAF